jgi:hypothetical protein
MTKDVNPEMRFEALPGSPLPEQLRDAGYDVTEIGQTQRILPHAITDELALADGSFGPVTEGSTMPVTRRVTHAGIATVVKFDLRVPAAPPDQGMRIAP